MCRCRFKSFPSLLCILLFTLVGCMNVAAETPAGTTKTALWATPARVAEGATIELHFPAHHPQNLAIRNPAGIWYVVHNDQDKIWIMPQGQYDSATHLQLDTETLTGTTWTEGKQVNEKVFVAKGEYVIYMADNLETEPENTFSFSTGVTLE